MSGRPGRSGVAKTMAERELKRQNAIKGGHAAAGRDTPDVEPDEMPVVHSPALLAMFPSLAGYPFRVDHPLALKDALEAVLRKAKADQADVELDEAKARRDQTRGSLLTREQAAREVSDYASALVDSLSSIIDAGLAHVPPERQPAARQAMQRAIDAIRAKAVSDIKGRK